MEMGNRCAGGWGKSGDGNGGNTGVTAGQVGVIGFEMTGVVSDRE